MKRIDFISQPPNNFIFQKESNKTKLGGLLSIIYIIFALLIFLLYISKYFLNDPYEIVSFISQEKSINTRELVEKFRKSEKYNPILNLTFTLRDYYYKNLSDRFIVYDYQRGIYIERDKTIQRRANDLHFVILYMCSNQTDCEIAAEDTSVLYLLTVQYDEFYTDPQSDIPIKRIENKIKVEPFVFNSAVKLRALFRWNIIRYENTKGLFDIFEKKEENDILKENNIYIGGYYQRYDTNILNDETTYVPSTRVMLMLDTIGLTISYNFFYEDFKRKRKSILDNLANIFSIWISLYNLFSFLFSTIYSKSFDKYKIMENILTKTKRKFDKTQNIYKTKGELNSKDILFEKESKIELTENFVINNIDNNEKDDTIININDIILTNKGKNERTPPKRTFLDFMFNTIYMEKCCRFKRQKIIVDCNEIILKYYSIENILYNQFLFENLIKDYKWNYN